MSVERAVKLLRRGEMVLIYDDDRREGETDIVFPASSVEPKDVRLMRRDGGGLICVALSAEVCRKLSLPYAFEIFRKASDILPENIIEAPGDVKYDSHSSFSIWVNHRDVFTGITDRDRALTIREIGKIAERVLSGEKVKFGDYFRAPGHVPVLRASDGLLKTRRGQTELSVALAEIAGITPAMVICEMLDEDTALPKSEARRYAEEKKSVFLEGWEIVEAWERLQEEEAS
ncbi:MAG: 3,4-dihydroxy-2-butanone-4-phosphate synthase [Archaeoglobi archaeon]|nr:3,4-dihydroxy-2-butanone-4-phosphate synthase [Candidatus Mnemosynella bozhongmuii]